MPTWRETLAPLLASSSSGVLARFPCHPLDTCKARLQVQGSSQNKYTSLFDTLTKTARAEGMKGLYRGFGITVIGSAPATCLYLTSYDAAKTSLSSNVFAGNEFLAHFTAGMIAETFSCILWVPIDVTKERLQIQEQGKSSTNYRGSMDAIRTILRTEGLYGIYKGYGATVASFGPYSAFYFMFYEQIKMTSTELYYSKDSTNATNATNATNTTNTTNTTSIEKKIIKELPFWLHLINASTASMMASFVTNPLDLIKLRLQVQRGGKGMRHSWGEYKGMIDGLRQVITTEGATGLFRGVGARMAFHGPSMAITIASYEKFKIWWEKNL
tara:strand:- start:2143 stop:3126 length:984 start_codon:yes stop_codon:yes gene_type:complete